MISVGLFVVALVFLVVGLSHTIGEIAEAVVIRDPSVILESEGISDGRPVSVPVLYRDLDDSGIFQSEAAFAKKDLNGITDWFLMVDETNPNYVGDIRLDYKADGAEFSFYKEQFYPLDEATATDYAAGNSVAKNDAAGGDVVLDEEATERNHLFAMAYGIPFTVLSSGDETFEVNADDNTLVFVNDTLVIDMDGNGEPATGVLKIQENGEVYVSMDGSTMADSGVNVTRDDSAIIRVFHLDKDPGRSVFNMKFAGLSPTLSVSNMKYSGDDSARVAYDPLALSTTLSSGVGKVFRASNAKNLIILATLEGAALMVFMFVTLSIMRGHKKKKH